METNALQNLKSKLPYQYGKKISEKCPGISAEQVRMVFTGEVTDPNIVEPVLTEALALHAQTQRIKKLTDEASKV